MASRKPITKLADLIPDDKNANRGTERGAALLENSLRDYGAGRSILLDKRGKIIAGNKTVEQAGSIGLDDVIVVQTDGTKLVAVQRMDLDLEKDSRAKALAIADNRVGQVSLEWDPAVLAELDKEIDLSNFWTEGELDELLSREVSTGEAPEAQLDIADQLRDQWGTAPGQIWAIGSKHKGNVHRLMCGDSTSKSDALNLFHGEAANLCFTSPPYGQQRDYGRPITDWDRLMQGVFDAAPLSDTVQIIVNLGLVHRDNEWLPYWDNWITWMRESGWRRFGFYVWDQGSGLPGDWMGRLAPSHEFLFHFNRAKRKPNKIIETKPESRKSRKNKSNLRNADGTVHPVTSPHLCGQSTKIPDSVVRINREAARGIHTEGHPAVFPVELPAFVMESWSSPGDICYEPFIGSGTSMVAAEQYERMCYGMEIEPKYVAVALQRMKDMGLEPRLVS